MSDIKEIVDKSSAFYFNSILNFDYKLCAYNFETFKPFFKGEVGLELGPASGYMTKYLVNYFKELHLVEGSKDLLSQIPDYPNVRKYHSLFEEFETKQKYHTIIMGHVLEHISNPVHTLSKIKTWLEPNGIFLISVPNAKSIHRMAAVEMGMLESIYSLNSRDVELGHYRVYDLTSLEKDIVEAGLTVVDRGGIFFKPISNKQIEENWTEEMINGFYKLGKFFPENCAEIFIACTK